MSDPETQHEESDEANDTLLGLVLGDSYGAAPPPLIVDPSDGLPRPKDEGALLNAIPAATEDNLICTEGGTWVPYVGVLPQGERPSDGARAPLPEGFDEARLVFDRVRFVEGARLRIYVDPVTNKSWVRTRPACLHYAEALTFVTAMEIEGHDRKPESLLRTCRLLKQNLFDETMLACSVREPPDLVSEQRLISRARAKAALAHVAPTPLFRSATVEEGGPVSSPQAATAERFVDRYGSAELQGFVPLDPASVVVSSQPLYVFFPDEAWQPHATNYYGQAFTTRSGEKRRWSASLTGELILRQSPGFAPGELRDGKPLTRIRQIQYDGHLRGIAKALVAGRHVAVVAYHADTVTAVRAAVAAAMANPPPLDIDIPTLGDPETTTT